MAASFGEASGPLTARPGRGKVAAMTIAELSLNPRTSGRATRPLEVEVLRPLGASDLALLASERGVQSKPIAKLRDRHHALARCLAQGMTNAEASAVTGYDPSRISILKADPTFQELVAQYTSIEDGLLADFTDRATNLSLSAMNEIADRLEDAPEEFSIPTLLEIVKTTADRTGHAPISKNVNVNVSAGMGDRLAAARKRKQAASALSAPVTDAEFEDVTPLSEVD
jgi:hypothetical protein